ncbi:MULTISPECIES: lipopolysaccharide assembly protein LapA domain-containing protein [unclassified Mycobacterium]|uniref:LapA family protein n=1 Tax=unclassified Mycobacterium TaxID=2642494 RepID=UPI0009931176|nr:MULTISPECIES: lipopolysaccharide assembly protein LapA domain-containing protein [unclassified Mycobacterium]
MTSDPGTTPDSPVADTSIDIPVGEQPPLPSTKPTKKEDAVKRTRAAATWTGVILGLLILILLLVFILQNLTDTTTHFLAWEIQMPLGITVLFAAITGAALTALVGGVRIIQLRRAAKKNLKA